MSLSDLICIDENQQNGLQRSAKKYANFAKQDPGRDRQGQAEQLSKSRKKQAF